MKIREREIGPGHPIFIVAELSCNHAGSLQKAHQLVEAAANAGADAIKLQTFEPAALAEKRDFGGFGQQALIGTPWEGRSLLDLYTEAHTPREWHGELFAHAASLGMIGFSSAFSEEAVYFLAHIAGSPTIKLSAYEDQDRGLWTAALTSGLPVIASVKPYFDASKLREQIGTTPSDQLALLHCVSKYPARCEDMSLSPSLKRLAALGHVYGLSDHTVCPDTAILAVALGASVIEVHLMLYGQDYEKPPLDAGHSWVPRGFDDLVRAIRHAEATL